jgi:hypothetical protein
MVMKLALRADRPLLPRIFHALISIRGWTDASAILQLGNIKATENSNDVTRELGSFRLLVECLNKLN